jgi:hypothetical protein
VYPFIALRAQHRCEYCRAPEAATGYRFEVEHIRPRAAGGGDDTENLALACRPCNAAKLTRTTGVDPVTKGSVALFNPRQDEWDDHFRWSGTYLSIYGRTDVGRATARALRFNTRFRRLARVYWRRVGLIP